MSQVVIISAKRTAVGGFGGALKEISPVRLAETVINSVIQEAGIEKARVGKVILGNCFAPLEQNIARISAYNAGLPEGVPGITINSTCGSSMQAVISGTQALMCKETDIVLTGGVESMSSAPYIMEQVRWGQRIKHATASDLLWRGMQEYPIGVGMGLTAENLAEKHSISREAQDEFAFQSHTKAASAHSKGKFKDEIVPFEVPRRKQDPLIFEADEHIRPDITMEKLTKLPPAFKKDGSVTAGNACGMNDAASALIMTTDDVARNLGLKPLAYVRAYDVSGVDPNIMGIGPVPSIRSILEKTGLSLDRIDRFEINEAFAAQYLACEMELGLNRENVNVNGGGIALGHPVGATGARLVVSLVHGMIADGLRYGVASLCAGGGMGFSVLLDRP